MDTAALTAADDGAGRRTTAEEESRTGQRIRSGLATKLIADLQRVIEISHSYKVHTSYQPIGPKKRITQPQLQMRYKFVAPQKIRNISNCNSIGPLQGMCTSKIPLHVSQSQVKLLNLSPSVTSRCQMELVPHSPLNPEYLRFTKQLSLPTPSHFPPSIPTQDFFVTQKHATACRPAPLLAAFLDSASESSSRHWKDLPALAFCHKASSSASTASAFARTCAHHHP